jgi:soluble lytic murein transglycosylase-like protein
MGVANAFDPRENIMGGVRYLKRLLDYHQGDLDLALASYNAGPANVERYGGVPPFRETRNYIKTVRQFLAANQESADAD